MLKQIRFEQIKINQKIKVNKMKRTKKQDEHNSKRNNVQNVRSKAIFICNRQRTPDFRLIASNNINTSNDFGDLKFNTIQ